MQFAEPWIEVIDAKQQAVVEAELRREVVEANASLFISARLLARRLDRDDYLFDTKDARWPCAVVHLTFSGRAEIAPFPATSLYATSEEAQARLFTDAADYEA